MFRHENKKKSIGHFCIQYKLYSKTVKEAENGIWWMPSLSHIINNIQIRTILTPCDTWKKKHKILTTTTTILICLRFSNVCRCASTPFISILYSNTGDRRPQSDDLLIARPMQSRGVLLERHARPPESIPKDERFQCFKLKFVRRSQHMTTWRQTLKCYVDHIWTFSRFLFTFS